ncbi:hypothetical protein L6R29_06750 [Myxococcota bacterium]|nr:hypothetical protein [Myxococcota bacterium]
MKKLTECQDCKKTFWYVDPRPGGRPRQKCGICSSRPPRYPWGFVDPNQPNNVPDDQAIAAMMELVAEPAPSEDTHSHISRTQTYQDSALLDSLPMPAYTPMIHATSEKTPRFSVPAPRRLTTLDGATIEITDTPDQHEVNMQRNANLQASRRKQEERVQTENPRLDALEQRLSLIEERLDQIEQRIDRLQATSISRSEWIDICARLDIVEQHTNETLERVRKRLDGFTREARSIAVIPERELNEINQVMRSIRAYLQPSSDDKAPRGGNR